uniref:Adrenodoxin-like protein, mitochondrial n=1 Tax=Aegilops tauschii TaxID=37682 RepID=R7W4F6_AEGTA
MAGGPSSPTPKCVGARISVTFVDKDGDETVINVPIGMSMLEAAHENDIELEVIPHLYLTSCASLDLISPVFLLAKGAYIDISRLGCQVIASPELDGIRLALPAATRNFAVDGHVPKPH